MKIKERKRDGVAILEMSGKLMGGPDADIPPAEAADGILRLVASDTYRDTPTYVVYNGEPYPY